MAASSSANCDASLPLDRPRSDGQDEVRTALIVNYLPQSMSDTELFSMFITLGPIKSHRIARDHRQVEFLSEYHREHLKDHPMIMNSYFTFVKS